MKRNVPDFGEIPPAFLFRGWWASGQIRPHGDDDQPFDEAIIESHKKMSAEEKEAHIRYLQDLWEQQNGPGGP